MRQFETKSVDIVRTPFYPYANSYAGSTPMRTAMPANFERTDIFDSREQGRYVPPPSPFYLLRDKSRS